MKESILEYVKNEYLDEDDEEDVQLDEHTPLITSGIVDSFSMVSLKTFLEKKFEISLSDEDATPEAFDTVSMVPVLVRVWPAPMITVADFDCGSLWVLNWMVPALVRPALKVADTTVGSPNCERRIMVPLGPISTAPLKTLALNRVIAPV